MSEAFFTRLVASEDLVITTNNLALSLKKVSADDVKGLSMENGATKVKLPANVGDMGGGNINAKVRRLLLAFSRDFAITISICHTSDTLDLTQVDLCLILSLYISMQSLSDRATNSGDRSHEKSTCSTCRDVNQSLNFSCKKT